MRIRLAVPRIPKRQRNTLLVADCCVEALPRTIPVVDITNAAIAGHEMAESRADVLCDSVPSYRVVHLLTLSSSIDPKPQQSHKDDRYSTADSNGCLLANA